MDWKIEYAINKALGYFSERHICRVAEDRWSAEKGCLFVICDGHEFGQHDGTVAAETAETIMEPLNGQTCEHSVPAATTLEKLIPLTAASDAPLAVVDTAGNALGLVNRTCVMMALAEGE